MDRQTDRQTDCKTAAYKYENINNYKQSFYTFYFFVHNINIRRLRKLKHLFSYHGHVRIKF
jgi:hypothetical protein